jgi:signal transduction histidine kinase
VSSHSLRRHAVGVAIVLAFILVPVAIRAATGGGDLGVGETAFVAAVVIAIPLALRFGFKLGESRRLGSFATVALGYGLASVAGVAIAMLWQVLGELGWSNAFNRDTTWLGQAANGAYMGIVMVGVWGLFMMMPQAVREARDREREHAELRREAERARVRSALEPHFVLNTLNAISGLLGEDPETARELIGDLGDLLRDVVRLSEQEVQSAASEVAWLQRYARILEARHPGKLTFEWSIDPEAASLGVPVLLLQPLLENAIYHGALRRPGGGRVRIELRRDAGALRCTIEDDGPGMASEVPSTEPRERPHGLDLTRRRLACDAPGSTLVVDSAPTGTRAVVQLAAT